MSHLHGGREAIVSHTAAGRPQEEVAAAAGISVRTLRRRLQEPEIVSAVADARLELERQAIGRLAALREEAFCKLRELIADEDPLVALRSCKLILDQGLAYRAAVTSDHITSLELRLAALVVPATEGAGR